MSITPLSPPRSPRRQESSDSQLYSVLARRPSLSPGSWSTAEDVKLPPLMRRGSAEGSLPGLSSILTVPRTASPQAQGIQKYMNALKLSTSPDPSAAGDHVFVGNSSEDATEVLAAYLAEKRRQQVNGLCKTGRPRRAHRPEVHRLPLSPERLDIRINYLPPSPPRDMHYYGSSSSSRSRSPDPLRPTRHGRVEKGSREHPHNNHRYSKEQMDFIRYLAIEEEGLTWAVREARFARQYPADPAKERRRQGVQGVYYRQNLYLPKLDLETNAIQYLPNGHQDQMEMKCRKMSKSPNPRLYGIINLWPEEALTYNWVKHEHKQEAMKIVEQRRKEREDAQTAAVKSGLWTENVPADSCACCRYLKR
ncbi:hypothetical protein AB5N19_12718 [Seiridium cardinale]|uniref:Uncharacterized protein n=1 Tax=Seiridium cardinale TaxID=138064 RepID=A0ABR2Y0L4_9PEZI